MLDEDKKTSAKSNNFRAYALVMSANFEAVAIFVSAWYFSQYLQEHYDIYFSFQIKQMTILRQLTLDYNR